MTYILRGAASGKVQQHEYKKVKAFRSPSRIEPHTLILFDFPFYGLNSGIEVGSPTSPHTSFFQTQVSSVLTQAVWRAIGLGVVVEWYVWLV